MSHYSWPKGSRIRCIDTGGWDAHLTVGKEYIFNYAEDDYVNIANDKGGAGRYRAHRFELVQENPNSPLPANPSNGDTNMFVKMTFITDRKINLIKELRSLTGSGLKEAKDAVEAGIIFNLTDFWHVRRFSKVVDMIDQTFAYHQAAYKLETYTPMVRPADPVACHNLFLRAPI